MNRKTVVAEELEAAGLKAQYDGHAKRVLGSRQVLARILQGAVDEYSGYEAREIEGWIEPDIEIASVPVRPGAKEDAEDRLITGDGTESKVPGEGTVTYDIKFQAHVPGGTGPAAPASVKLLINVEAQKKFYMKYRIVTRGVFYGARMISDQLDREFTGSNYNGLKKVYSIWICMNAPKHIGNAMSEYRIVKQDIIGSIPEAKRNYDKLSVIVICLNERAEDKANDQANGKAHGDLHGFLNTLLSTRMTAKEKEETLARDYGIEIEREVGEELKEMCNLSEAIEEKAIQKGKREGKREGIKQGEENFAALTERLLKDYRNEDLLMATRDRGYRERLYREYHIREI